MFPLLPSFRFSPANHGIRRNTPMVVSLCIDIDRPGSPQGAILPVSPGGGKIPPGPIPPLCGLTEKTPCKKIGEITCVTRTVTPAAMCGTPSSSP
jgi:hypothetical protein